MAARCQSQFALTISTKSIFTAQLHGTLVCGCIPIYISHAGPDSNLSLTNRKSERSDRLQYSVAERSVRPQHSIAERLDRHQYSTFERSGILEKITQSYLTPKRHI